MPLFNTTAPTPISVIIQRTVDFNAGNTDTPIPISLPAGCTRYLVSAIRISGASGTLTTSTFGLYTAAAAGGVAIVAAVANTISTASEDTAANTMASTPATSNTQSYTAPILYFRVGTPQGVAATANVALQIIPVS